MIQIFLKLPSVTEVFIQKFVEKFATSTTSYDFRSIKDLVKAAKDHLKSKHCVMVQLKARHDGAIVRFAIVAGSSDKTVELKELMDELVREHSTMFPEQPMALGLSVMPVSSYGELLKQELHEAYQRAEREEEGDNLDKNRDDFLVFLVANADRFPPPKNNDEKIRGSASVGRKPPSRASVPADFLPISRGQTAGGDQVSKADAAAAAASQALLFAAIATGGARVRKSDSQSAQCAPLQP